MTGISEKMMDRSQSGMNRSAETSSLRPREWTRRSISSDPTGGDVVFDGFGGVPCRLDGIDQHVNRSICGHGHRGPLGCVVDAGLNTIELIESALDQRGAGPAGHSGDRE